MPQLQSDHPFALEHGGNPLFFDGGWVLPDGATIRGGDFGPIFCRPPSPDPFTRLRVRKAYHAERLDRAEYCFKHLDMKLKGIAEQYPHWKWDTTFGPMPEDPAAHLDRVIAEERAAVAELDSELAHLMRGAFCG